MLTKLTIVRHGETEWNRIGKQQGQLDSPLTEDGIRQAQAIAAAIRAEYDLLISSDLGRATQTAEIIGKKLALPITIEQGLRERNLGILQTLTIKEFSEKFPEEHKRFILDDPIYCIPDGESAEQRFERAIKTFESIVQTYAGKNIFIVTHGGILDSLFRHTLGIPLAQRRDFSLVNGSINIFIHNQRWKLESWGDISHLRGIHATDDF